MKPLTLQYRPVDFETVVGQDHITSILREQIASGSAKSNYLFFGPRGTGKTSTARILAKALNCVDADHGNPCNKCVNCQAIADGTTLDIVEIDAASHTGVDNVREEIIAKVAYQPTQLKKKVYIIDEVHMLSKGAFNALLKIMEEPPAYVTFILATTEIHKVLETIISRCQCFQFHRVSRDAIVQRLQVIADSEGIKTDADALGTIAKVSEGIMRDAVKYLDQVSVLGDVTGDRVQQFLGMVNDEQIAGLLEILAQDDARGAIEQVIQLQAGGVDMSQFAKQILAYIDEHFLDDVEQMAKMADLFGKILSEMKYYPYPLLVYKRYFGGMGVQSAVSIKAPVQKKSTVFEIPASESAHYQKWKDKQLTKGESTEEGSGKTLKTEATIKKEEEKNDEVVKEEEVITKEKKKEKVEKQMIEQLSDEDLTNTDILKTHIINNLPAGVLKGLMDKYVMVDAISGSCVNLIVINKAVEISLNKDANKESVRGVLSSLFGKVIDFTIESMTKEEYAMKLLG